MAMMNGRETTRAERFEDEKKRIIDSCFNKKDEDGSVLETYITHIKVTEYSTHPSTPPPPQSRTPQSEKARVIIIAVRKSGRVRVHKSKENPNGTFSIGKTWNLDDLGTIESFTGPTTSANLREWAGDLGFTVTLGKPYYWQAQTDKEKKFFIASLIKIFGKYTGGRVPNLTGFDPRELEQVLGGAQAPRRQQERPPPVRPPHGVVEAAPTTGGGSASASLASSAYNGTGVLTPAAQPTPPPTAGSERLPSRGGLFPNGSSSPSRSIDSSRKSHEHPPGLRRLAANNISQDSLPASFATRSDDGSSLRPRSRNGTGSGTSTYPTPEPPAVPTPPPPLPVDEAPPERRRPPMDPLRPRAPDEDLVPAPLLSPAMRREPMVPPRNMERMSPRRSSFGEKADLPPTATATAATIDKAVAPKEPPAGTVSPPSDTPISLNAAVSPLAPPETPKEPTTPPIPAEPEDTRPGLGPMIKSKKSKADIAGAFWKAAAAASAFKPRPGGAGERLRQNQNKSNDGPDGITSVVPAPPKPSPALQKPAEQSAAPTTPEPGAGSGADEKGSGTEVPQIKVMVPNSSRPTSLQASLKEATAKKTKDEPPKEEEDGPRRSIVAGNDVKYLASLGIDPAVLLDGRSTEFAKWLDYFGWVPGDQMRARNFEEMKVDVDREMNKSQAGGWLARFQEEDERVDAIKKGIDLAIAECDELDNLLTLYSVELSTLSDDIAYIEAQGQGLQVQAANQKLLKKELESLLETCAISDADLDALRSAPLESAAGVEEIETALVTLYKAMLKIDPSMGGSSGESSRKSLDDGTDQPSGLDSDYGKMRIVQEKKEMYTAGSALFMRRLVEFMARQFDEAFRRTRTALDGALSKKVDARNHDAGRDMLWMYSPLVLYAREVDLPNWDRIIQLYQDKGQPVYRSEFRDAVEVWKKGARKNTGDDANELLFTSLQEKKEEGIATTARKLTVKRSQTLARTLRSPLGDGGSRVNLAEKTAAAAAAAAESSKTLPYEVFAGVMDDLLPLVEMEQNFIVDFFHATTLEQTDFPDAVGAARPRDRRGGDLKRHRLMEPDRDLARRVTRAMEVIFNFLEQNVQQLVDWVLSIDPLQGVGVLATLERKMADMSQTNQDFLNNVLQKLHGSLEGRFTKFVDEQVRAIEETKVKIKKRKGVIGFMRIFPQFSTAVENMLANAAGGAGADANLAIRRTIDHHYDRILKTMFDSLKVIARENPAVSGVAGAGGGGGGGGLGGLGGIGGLAGSAAADPEDKEALNFHILLIENMNHYLEEVDNARGLEVLEDWREAAQRELAEHLGLYVNAVVRRPLGRLLEHLENVEAQLAAGKSPAGVAAQPSNAKAAFNKVLGGYDAREVRKGIETLRKRVEKHFSGSDSDADDSSSLLTVATASTTTLGGSNSNSNSNSNNSGGGGKNSLVLRVLRECERYYGDVEMRIGTITTNVYGGDVLFEWPRAEVKSAFSVFGR